jgi:hypothetical protein
MAQFLAQFTRRSVPEKTTDSSATYVPFQTIEVAGNLVWIQVTMCIFVTRLLAQSWTNYLRTLRWNGSADVPYFFARFSYGKVSGAVSRFCFLISLRTFAESYLDLPCKPDGGVTA